MIKNSTYEFIEKARKIHNDKYDCSKVIYEAERIPITIIYHVNGEYKQIHLYHYNGMIALNVNHIECRIM